MVLLLTIVGCDITCMLVVSGSNSVHELSRTEGIRAYRRGGGSRCLGLARDDTQRHNSLCWWGGSLGRTGSGGLGSTLTALKSRRTKHVAKEPLITLGLSKSLLVDSDGGHGSDNRRHGIWPGSDKKHALLHSRSSGSSVIVHRHDNLPGILVEEASLLDNLPKLDGTIRALDANQRALHNLGLPIILHTRNPRRRHLGIDQRAPLEGR